MCGGMEERRHGKWEEREILDGMWNGSYVRWASGVICGG
jgi:hypothetical protein